MKLSVDFPSISHREGPDKIIELAKAIEAIGYDDLAVFDHVVMGHATESRPAPMYPPKMPILEALVTLGFVAAVTNRVTLSTEVLVLPQRQAVLAAKQVSTLDTLSGGRMRLGVGVGWQAAEYEALGEDFATRGKTMDQAIDLLRACWRDERIAERGERFDADEIAMEPKPPQREHLPVWIGGSAPAALRRAGTVGDGWMGVPAGSDDQTRTMIDTIHRHAEAAERDPATVGLQAMLSPPPTDAGGKDFYADHDRVARRAEDMAKLGFEWLSVNATAIFQAGARSVDAMAEELDGIHARLSEAVGNE